MADGDRIEAFKCADCGKVFADAVALAGHHAATAFYMAAPKTAKKPDGNGRNGDDVVIATVAMIVAQALRDYPEAVDAASAAYYDTLYRNAPIPLQVPLSDGDARDDPNG